MTVEAAYRIDGVLRPRAAFYAAACDPRRSVVVEACAGSGKTWMLVSRILRALLDGCAPHEILAITFTRKAAGEMRERLNDWLAGFAEPGASDAQRVEALRERGLDEASARSLAPALAGLHEHILRSGRAVEVCTFHAWFAQLLRAAPLELLAELGLPPAMELLEDLADHRGAVYRRFHAAVLADDTLRADHQALLERRGRSQLRKWLDTAWDKRIEIELADAAGTLEASVAPAGACWPQLAGLAEPLQWLRSAVVQRLMREVARELGAQPGVLPRRCAAALEAASTLQPDAAAFAAARAALFTKAGKLRKALAVPGLDELAAQFELMQAATAQQEAHEEHRRMLRLSRVLLRELAAYKRSRGLAEMSDLERGALALLRDSSASAWVHERLDTRVRQVLIDEFQDTSPLQWHALQAWLSGYAGAGGGASGQRPPSVFIVGDPKQSIYRFRRAEPRVFDAARDFVVQGLHGQVLGCDHTRRNAPEVLGALNHVFGEAARDGEFDGFSPHTTELPPVAGAGVFSLTRVPRARPVAPAAAPAWRDSLTVPRREPDEVLRRVEADRVAAAIAQLRGQGVSAGDIQVLCRKRESLRLVAQSLAALQLPGAAVEDFPLLESPELRDLVALLDVLASPGNDLSLAQALRSPVFGASDDDLIRLADAARGPGDWWRALQAMDDADAGPALRRAQTLLRRWQADAQALPPHDLLDRMLADGELIERTAATVPPARRQAALGAIDALLALSLTLDGARHATPYNFVRALKRRSVALGAPAQPDAVQLLTVHGAKGLEARIVFVMDADPQAPATETASLLVDWPVESAHPRACAFVYAESQCPPSLRGLLARELAARERETLNALYVAMTRAKERLIVSATEPQRAPPGRSWWQRLEPVARPWDDAAAPAAASPAPPAASPLVLKRLPAWAGASASVSATAEATVPSPAAPADEERSALGQAMHRALEWLAGATPPRALQACCEAAAAEFAAPAAEVQARVSAILKSPACKRFLAPPDIQYDIESSVLWAANEVSLPHQGEWLRIDRLVALGTAQARCWWVLDYKLGRRPQDQAANVAQMRRYIAAVQALQPGDTVTGAFITSAGELIPLAP